MKNKKGLLIIIGLVGLIAVFLFVSYNGLVKKDEKVALQFNEMQNAYQRRLDLIPNLVNTVSGASDFEKNVLVDLTTARAKATQTSVSSASDSSGLQQQANAQNELANAANRLIIAVERYPELQGAKAYATLQTQLERTELRIKVARKDFNQSIQDYNSSVRSFPTSLAPWLFGFKAKSGFIADEGAERAGEIKF